MRELFADISQFNSSHKSSFSSFDDLLQAQEWSPKVRTKSIDDHETNRLFLLQILARYYAVACATLRNADPSHLIFGDILNAQTGVPDEVLWSPNTST